VKGAEDYVEPGQKRDLFLHSAEGIRKDWKGASRQKNPRRRAEAGIRDQGLGISEKLNNPL
jgi:hypothetical protein